MSAKDEQVGGDHYKSMAIQPIEFCHKNGLGYCESLAIKYICRHGKKNGRQDIEKAIHCLRLLADMAYPVGEPQDKLYRTLSQEEIDWMRRTQEMDAALRRTARAIENGQGWLYGGVKLV